MKVGEQPQQSLCFQGNGEILRNFHKTAMKRNTQVKKKNNKPLKNSNSAIIKKSHYCKKGT